MGELKPIGSEKLKVDDKLKRILELTYYKENNKTSNSNSQKADYIAESTSGMYGIVKEKDGYYVKKGLNESSLDYIGGMFMKNKNKFSSYAEAFKRLDLLKGQENLQEDTKYILKNKGAATPQSEAPAPEPTNDVPPAPAPDATAPAPDASAPAPDAMSPDAGIPAPSPMDAASDMPPALPPSDGESPEGEEGMEGGEQDHLKVVQKLTGKLGQKLRDAEKDMKSDDIKYVINSVMSALNLDKLDDVDKEEIVDKFDSEGEEGFGEPTGEEPTGDEPASEPTTEPSGEEGDLGEVIDKLESVYNTPFDTDTDDVEDKAIPGEMERERLRTKKHHVEPDSDEDMYYRQSSKDYSNDYGFDSEGDDFDDLDTYNFDVKEDDGNIHDPEFYEKGDVDESHDTKEIDIHELTDIINNSVKEALGKYLK